MDSPARRVAITGGSGYIGTRLIEQMEGDPSVARILILDVRPLPRSYGPKVVYLQRDITDPIDDVLSEHEIDVVVHLAFILKAGHNRVAIREVDVSGSATVLESSARSGVRHIVYFSSTTVYGAHADNPPALTESAAVRPVKGFQYGEDKAASEALLREFAEAHPEIVTTVLRGCPVMGPNADNFISRTFQRRLLVGIVGYDPEMQLLHEDDLTDILARCIRQRIPGLYNVAGRGTIRWSEMAAALDRRLLMLPSPLIYWLTSISWTLRLQFESPASGLDFIRFPWTAGTEKIQSELGVHFRYSSREAWEAFVHRRRGLVPVPERGD